MIKLINFLIKNKWLLIIFIVSDLTAFAQNELTFKRINTGFSSNNIRCIVQDKYGFMWFGTNTGLNRFDGHKIKVLLHNPADKNTLSNDTILCFLRDKQDRIWIGTKNGLNLFDPLTYKFIRFQTIEGNPKSLQDNAVHQIYEDNYGRIWLACATSLNLMDLNTFTFTQFKHNPKNPYSLDKYYSPSIFQDADDTYWVGTWFDLEGIDTFRIENMKFGRLAFQGRDKRKGKNLSPELLNSVYRDSRNNLWFSCFTGIYYRDHKTKEFTFYHYYDSISPFQGSVRTVNEDFNGNIWIGTNGNGIFIYDIKAQKFNHYRSEPGNIQTLSDNRINQIYKDNTNKIWFATANGVSVLNLYENQFNKIEIKNNNHISYSLGQEHIIEDMDGNIIFDYGIGLVGQGGDRIGAIKYNINSGKTVFYNDKSFRRILYFALSSGGEIYFSTDVGIFKIVDNSSRALTKSFFSEFIAFDRVNKGMLWLLKNYLHVLIVDNKTDLKSIIPLNKFQKRNSEKNLYEFKIKDLVFDEVPDLPSNFYYKNEPVELITILIDKENQIWSIKAKLKEKNNVIVKINRNTSELEELFPDKLNNVRTFTETHSGNFIICTYNGVFEYNKYTNTLTDYTQYFDFSKNPVYKGITDENRNYWFFSDNTIIKFNPEDKIIENYTIGNEITSNNHHLNCFFGERSKNIYFPSKNGIYYFKPENLKADTNQIKTYITNFKIFNSDIQPDTNIFAKKTITLKHNQDFFTIEFSAFNYSGEKYTYQYILENLNENWISTENTEVNFNKVPAGNYIFKLKTINEHGIMSNYDTVLEIIVLPPWWRTWWAYLLYVLALTGSILAFIQWRTYKFKEQKRVLKIQVEERTAEINQQKEEIQTQAEQLSEMVLQLKELDHFKQNMSSMIVHDLKNPLNLIINQAKETKIAQTGRQMLNMVMNILDIQKFEEAKMNLNREMHNLKETLQKSVQQIDYLLEEKNLVLLNYIHTHIYCIYDEELIERVFINLLTNAIKYSPMNEKIIINSVQVTEGNQYYIKIEIIDKGKGIPEEFLGKIFEKFAQHEAKNLGIAHSTGLGLLFCKHAIEAHNGKINVTSKTGEGSNFNFTIPAENKLNLQNPEEQIISHTEDKYNLKNEELLYLKPFVNKLKTIDFYSFTELMDVLNAIKENESTPLKRWKNAIKNAIENFNEEKYNQLINIDSNEEIKQ